MLGLLYSFGYFRYFFISESGKFTELDLNRWIAKLVGVGYVFYDVILNEKINNTFSDAHNIHTIFADEILDLLFRFFRTIWIDTVIMHIFLHYWLFTGRANFWWMNDFFFTSSAISNNTDDVGNYLSASL
jgi:hypothetical protein